MFLCAFQIVVEVVNATHAQFISRVDDRSSIQFEFFRDFQQRHHGAGGRGHVNSPSRGGTENSAQPAEASVHFEAELSGFFHLHLPVSRTRFGQLAQAKICITDFGEDQICIEAGVVKLAAAEVAALASEPTIREALPAAAPCCCS